MKRHLIAIPLLSLLTAGASSRAAGQGSLFVHSTPEAVFLRYVENEGDLPGGYNVYRRAEGAADWELLTPQPVRPILSAENLRQIAGTRAEILVSMLGGDESTDDLTKGDFDRVLTNPETRNFFVGMTLAIRGLGRAMGQEFVDTDVHAGTTFEYRVTVLRGGVESDLVLSGPVVHGETTELPVPEGLTGFPGDGDLFLDWERDKPLELRYGIVGYNVYRAEGDISQPFTRINSTPVLDIAFGGPDAEKAYRDPGVRPGVRYWYRITSVSTFGFESDPSDPIVLEAQDATPPAAVEDLGVRVTPDAVFLTWSPRDEPDLRGYEVFRSRGTADAFERVAPSQGRAMSGTSYLDSDVAPGEIYWYQVRAVDAAGNAGTFGDAVQVFLRDLIPPPKVLGLKADAREGRVRLSWDAVDDPTLSGYAVERSLTPERADEFWFRLADELPAVTFTDTLWNRQEGEVSYRVRAGDASGNEGPWSDVVTVRPPDRVPPQPPFLKSVTVAGDTVRLGWDPSRSDDVAGYHVLRSTEQSGGFARVTEALLPPIGVTYSDRPRTTGRVYWYRIEAVDEYGNVSDPSNTMGITFADEVPPPPPADLVAASARDGVRLTWTEPRSDDLKGYNIYRKMHDEREMVLLDQMPRRGSSFLDYTAETGETYVYQVSAYDESYNVSAPAGPVTITYEPGREDDGGTGEEP